MLSSPIVTVKTVTVNMKAINVAAMTITVVVSGDDLVVGLAVLELHLEHLAVGL